MERLNIEFKESIEEEMIVKNRKTNKTMASLKEIIEQKNSDLENKDNEVNHVKRK